MFKVLIIDEMHDSIHDLLSQEGFLSDYRPNISRAEILEVIASYQGIVVRSKTRIDREIFDKASALKFIGRAGAGLDNIDLHEAKKRNIAVVNAPEGNRDALGEHAVAMLLSLMNNISRSDHDVRNFLWHREENRGHELGGLTVGLFGYGNMASAFARKLVGFGCDVIAYDKYKSGFSSRYVKEVSMEAIFERSDVFSLHTPLTDETRGYINYDLLNSFAKPIWLVNTSRGEVAPIEDTLALLKEGKIIGAALDVLEVEKFDRLGRDQKEVYTKLFSLSNVILSPHVAGWTFESYRKINEVLVSKIISLNLQD